MNCLHRYIISHILKSTGLVLAILLSIVTFLNFVGELWNIGEGAYHLPQAIVFIITEIPYSFYLIFPMAALLGTLLALGQLANSSELIIMRAAGMSMLNISTAVLKAAVLLIIVAVLIGEGLAPHSSQFGDNYQTMKQSGGQAFKTEQGTWLRVNNNFVHIDQIKNNNNILGITEFAFKNNHQLRYSFYAKSASYKNANWKLNKVKLTQFESNQVKSTYLDTAKWSLKVNPDLLRVDDMLPQEMTLPKLWGYIKFHAKSGQVNSSYAYAFWKRVYAPFTTIVMMLLAIPFIFGPLRSVTMGVRIMVGIIVGFAFYTLNQLFGPISLVYQFPPMWAALIPTLAFALFGTLVLLREGR